MIDLETLSTKPNATILTIGGVKFDAYTRVEPSQGLYHRIDVDSQVAMGSLVPRDPNEKRTGLHNALDDCYFQARKVQQIFQQLDIRNDRY